MFFLKGCVIKMGGMAAHTQPFLWPIASLFQYSNHKGVRCCFTLMILICRLKECKKSKQYCDFSLCNTKDILNTFKTYSVLSLDGHSLFDLQFTYCYVLQGIASLYKYRLFYAVALRMAKTL